MTHSDEIDSTTREFAVPDLLIRLKKKSDGSAALTCVRVGGTTTWQRQLGKLGAFFPLHDLTHFVVETTLGYDRGFFGLIADGWEFADFAAPWPRGVIPQEAREVEAIVGALDLERFTMQRGSTAEFNEQTRFALSRDAATAVVPREITDDELARVRKARAEVLSRWSALEPGETLELEFDRGTTASS